MSEAIDTRSLFEERVFAERFLKSIQRNPNIPKQAIADALDFLSIDCPTKADFCRRNEAGNYVDPNVSAMWFGWQLREKSLPPPPQQGDE